MHNNDRVTTTASEGRKSSKPIMEKKRRARINASLSELKTLLLEVIKKEGACHNKMEKADILEMAVKHLRHIQRQQFNGESSSESAVANKYKLGFHACAQEVSKYLGSNSDEDVEMKAKLLNHLANVMTDASLQPASGVSTSSFLPSSSSTSIPTPLSPLSMRSTSPSSTLSPEERSEPGTDARHLPSLSSVKLDLSNNFGVKDERQKGVVSFQVPDTRTGPITGEQQILDDRILQSLSMLPQSEKTIPVQPPVAIFKPSSTVGDNGQNNNNNNERQHNNYVSEINNNTITIPTFINVGGQTALTSLQRQLPNQFEPQQFPTQQLQHPSPQQQQQQAIFQDGGGGGLITNMNRLQLIPTKTVNGELAFVLSTNILNTAQFPSYTIPVLTQPAVNQTQILAPPPHQQAIQIAVSSPQDDQNQPLLYVPPLSQSDTHSSNYSLQSVTSTTENIPTTQQAMPLNLSSTKHKTTSPKTQTQHYPIIPNVTLPSNPIAPLPFQGFATSSVPSPTCLNLGNHNDISDKSISPFHLPLPVSSHALAPPLASLSTLSATSSSPSDAFLKPQPVQMPFSKPEFIQSKNTNERESQHIDQNIDFDQTAHPHSYLDIALRSDTGKMYSTSTRRESNFFRPWNDTSQ